MKIFIILVLAALGLNLQVVASNTLIRPDSQNSDEAFYKLTSTPTQKEYNAAYANVRKFVWEHWISNRLGTVILESYTKEGQRVLSTFKIKAAPNDLVVEVSIEREYFDRKTRKSFKSLGGYVGEDVNRVLKPKNGLVKGEAVSREASLSPESYLLRITNSKKEVLAEF